MHNQVIYDWLSEDKYIDKPVLSTYNRFTFVLVPFPYVGRIIGYRNTMRETYYRQLSTGWVEPLSTFGHFWISS